MTYVCLLTILSIHVYCRQQELVRKSLLTERVDGSSYGQKAHTLTSVESLQVCTVAFFYAQENAESIEENISCGSKMEPCLKHSIACRFH